MSDDAYTDDVVDDEMHKDITYVALPTLREFHADDSLVRGIMGPYGSGKSSACVWELFRRAREQRPYKGVRKSKWAIIRNTYAELETTTLETFTDWMPEMECDGYSLVIRHSHPMRAQLNMQLEDGTKVDATFIFMALDNEDVIGKLKSIEFTGGWINEAVELPQLVFITLLARSRRFPAKRDGGYSWAGVIMDTNPPDIKHWWYELAEKMKPLNYRFWRQPPAILPLAKEKTNDPQLWVPNRGQAIIGPDGSPIQYAPAENVENQNAGFDYWLDLAAGQDESWCRVFLMGEYGLSRAGKPVFPAYQDSIHCTKEPIEVWRGLPILLGWDFGRTPCVLFMQLTSRGTLNVIEEIASDGMGIREFANNIVRPRLRNKYYNMPVVSIGDPSGKNQSDISDELTCMNELRAAGIPTEPAITQNYTQRLGAVNSFLRGLVDGKPAFQMSPECQLLREAFQREYRYGERRTTAGRVFTEEPLKLHPWSDLMDCLEYMAMHLDQGAAMSDSSGRTSGNTPRRNVRKKSSSGWA